MSNEGDYEALEKSVRYIPWKGKKEEWYTWHKTFLVRAMIHGYHGVLVGLEEFPTDDKAKVLASTEKLGHPAEEMVKLTGNYMKISNRGKMENLCKLRHWKNATEKRRKRTEGKIIGAGISFLHRHCVIKIY